MTDTRPTSNFTLIKVGSKRAKGVGRQRQKGGRKSNEGSMLNDLYGFTITPEAVAIP
jgi:hypothetical protein